MDNFLLLIKLPRLFAIRVEIEENIGESVKNEWLLQLMVSCVLQGFYQIGHGVRSN